MSLRDKMFYGSIGATTAGWLLLGIFVVFGLLK
jgi:hypothetical protein